MTEERLSRTVILTLITYGAVSFLQWKKFVLPLPAFEIVILALCLYFAFRNWKLDKIASLLFLLFGIGQFLSREFNFVFFLSDQSITSLSHTIATDVFHLLAMVFLIALWFRQRGLEKRKLPATLVIAFLLAGSVLVPQTYWIIVPFLLANLLFIKNKNLFQKGHSLWFYLLIFAVSRELTLWLL